KEAVMGLDRRFRPGYSEQQTSEPGLVQAEDDIVYVVAPDGTRTAVGGGGGGGGGLKVTRVSVNVVDIVRDDAPVEGIGTTIYSALAGELMLFPLSGISIAPGDEFDGDLQCNVYVDGQQTVSEFASCFAGDVNVGPDNGQGNNGATYGVAGFWMLPRQFGAYPAGTDGAVISQFLQARWIFGTARDLKAVMTNGPGAPPTTGVIEFIIATIPPPA
ncbi:MAG: hypothetical protein ACJ79H_04380, partial [Myxococcales bacterium]